MTQPTTPRLGDLPRPPIPKPPVVPEKAWSEAGDALDSLMRRVASHIDNEHGLFIRRVVMWRGRS